MQKKLALFVNRFDDGGITRCFSKLADGMLNFLDPPEVHILTSTPIEKSFYLQQLSKDVSVHVLNSAQPIKPQVIDYHNYHKPSAFLTGQLDDAALLSDLKRRLNQIHPTMLAFSLHTHISGELAGRNSTYIKKIRYKAKVKRIFAKADIRICVSRGVATDLKHIMGNKVDMPVVIRNPVVGNYLLDAAAQPADHPWLQQHKVPVVMSCGRLAKVKNFELLISSFAKVLKEREAKLIILGDGKLKESLIRLAQDLNIHEHVALPGFTPNPYAFMRRADLFVVSSLWEGASNVLVEAMACGTQAISTDCPSGPREILNDGEFGDLVENNNAEALAATIAQRLSHPISTEKLAQAVHPYRIEASARSYLEALRLSS